MHECWCPEVQTIAGVYHLSTRPYPPTQLFPQLSTDSSSVRCGRDLTVALHIRAGAVGHPLSRRIENQETNHIRRSGLVWLLVVSQHEPKTASDHLVGPAAAIEIRGRRVLAGRGHLLKRNRSDRALYDRVRHAEIYYLESACRVAVVRLSIALHLDGDRERTGM